MWDARPSRRDCITSLLDPLTMHYVLSGKVWKVGTGDITDKTEKIVGSVKRKMVPTGAQIRLIDSDGKVLCEARRKALGLIPVYDITDAAGGQLGRVEKRAVELNGSSRMYNPSRKELLRATGSAVGWEFTIGDSKRKNGICATIRRADTWDRTFVSRPDLEEKYFIDIEDSEADRLLLLTYCIVITDASHNA
jgi:uncharacterized protein YxjI